MNSITYTYDALGRQLSRTVNGQTTSMSYNDMLRTNTTTLPGGRVMTETFYPTGERKRLSGSDTYTQEWSWNSTWETKASLTTWKTDSEPQTTSWSYDVRGNLISKTYPDNSGPVYTYDADGKLLTRTWARQVNGQPLVTTFTYDNAGRSTGYSYSDGTMASVSFTNDYLGRKESVTDASGTHEFSYGANTLLTSVSSPVVANSSVSYSYDAYGRKTGMQVSVNGQSGTSASYTYDPNGRLSSLGNGSRTLHYSYLPGTSYVSSRQWKDADDASHQSLNYTYDSQHRLTSVKLGTAPEVSYTLNAKNQRVQMSFGDGSYWDYSYDDKGQITGAVKRDADGTALAGMQYGYVYDGIGNRESAEEGSSANAVTYSSNQLNQYTAINTALPTYDADGNLLTTGNGWSYTYNGENRLIQAENSDTKLVLSYDYMGRRFEKKVYTKGILSLYSWSLSKHYRYIYDDYKLVEIRDTNDGNALLKSFVWQPADAGQDVPLSMSYDGSTYYYIVDGNKNVTGLQDESGNRVATYTYGPFGQLLSMDGGLAEENPLRFSSEYFDDETGLVYYNYRYYSPRMGRWINRDPIEEEGGVNLYAMLGNNIIMKVDHKGLFGTPPDLLIDAGDADIWYCERAINTSGLTEEEIRQLTQKDIQHVYINFGVDPWGNRNIGVGFSGGNKGTLPSAERSFHPTRCKACYNFKGYFRKLEYGTAKKKRCCKATRADIINCIENYPARKKYHSPDTSKPFLKMLSDFLQNGYVCWDWAKEALAACCLTCDNKYKRSVQ